MRLRRRRDPHVRFSNVTGLTTSLVACGDEHGCPLVYFTDGYGYSLVWKGTERYADAIEAQVAASSHVRDTLAKALDLTSERKAFA